MSNVFGLHWNTDRIRRDVFGRLGSIQLQKYDTKLFPGQMGSLYMFLARFAVSYSVSDLRVHD